MDESIRLMTYNVRQDLDGDGDNAWRYRRDAVASILRFHGADIIGCQEVRHGQLQDLGERLPEYRWIDSGRLDGETEGEFCPIGFRRDRFDPGRSWSFWLSEAPETPGSIGWNAAYPRIATMVELTDHRSDTAVLHANTHLDNEGTTARKAGVRLLLERAQSVADDRPVLVTGDFNCTAASDPYRSLTRPETPLDLSDARTRSKHGHHGPRNDPNRLSPTRPRPNDRLRVRYRRVVRFPTRRRHRSRHTWSVPVRPPSGTRRRGAGACGRGAVMGYPQVRSAAHEMGFTRYRGGVDLCMGIPDSSHTQA